MRRAAKLHEQYREDEGEDDHRNESAERKHDGRTHRVQKRKAPVVARKEVDVIAQADKFRRPRNRLFVREARDECVDDRIKTEYGKEDEAR